MTARPRWTILRRGRRVGHAPAARGRPGMLPGAGSRIDGRGDVHGPGLVLHELLTGRRPSPTEPMPQAVRHTLEGSRRPARGGSIGTWRRSA